jgi:Chain length determinant protein.
MAFKKAFEVKEKGKKTGILEFTYQDIYPDRATEILNEIASNYLRQNVEQRNAEAQKTLEFLEKQLPDVKAQMDSSLLKYNTYRNKIGSIDINAETKSFWTTGRNSNRIFSISNNKNKAPFACSSRNTRPSRP